MANKTINQHYIPQLLLRNFSDNPKARQPTIWVFREGSAPFRTSPRNIGAERFFYADPDESSVEADLGSREGKFARLLSDLGAHKSIRAESIPLVAELVGQMAARTKNSRDGLTTAADTAIRDAVGAVLQSKSLKKDAARDLQNRFKGSGVPLEQWEELAEQAMPSFLDFFEEQGGIEGLLKQVNVGHAAKTAQVQVLETKLPSMGQRFQGLDWKISEARQGTFILGDLGPVALSRRKKKAAPGSLFSSKHDLIVLPVSDIVAIVGGASGFELDELNTDRLATATAKLSMEFFVARFNGAREKALQGLIGADRDIWKKEPRRRYKKKLDRLS